MQIEDIKNNEYIIMGISVKLLIIMQILMQIVHSNHVYRTKVYLLLISSY